MRFEFKRGKKKFKINAHKCNISSTGLMFKRRKNAKALIFNFKKSSRMALTSLFVFFEFLVLWLDERDNVVDMKICKPWKVYINTKKSFSKILEIPKNKKYEKIIKKLI
ncbi:MAG: DUF192 domain-containing protein [Candidatus Pacearchaeota archaeon]|jgi:uncharacterized membrane protein (UPF0127 family)